MTEIIGRGERAALQIFKEIYGDTAEYFIQYRFKDLLNDVFKDTLSERQEKETIDIVVKLPVTTLAVRIQDAHHTGRLTSMRDTVQKKTLEWNNCAVIDLWFHDCPELWKDVVNQKSIDEVTNVLKSLNLYP